MNFTVELHKSVIKFFEKNRDSKLIQRFSSALEAIAQNPTQVEGFDVRKLQGYECDYRLRLGKYRFLYTIQNEALVVFVFSADSRGDVYK